MGGTGVLMQGGIHPDLKIDWFERLFTGIKQRFPQIWLHCLSASEVLAIAEYSDLSLRDTIARLRDAGLDSIPGGGAEILDDEVRHRIARLKCNTEDWVSVHRTAHELGHADHGHHDVRRGRNLRAAHQSLRSGSPPAGRDRRIHRLHPLELPARATPPSAAAAGKKPPASNI